MLKHTHRPHNAEFLRERSQGVCVYICIEEKSKLYRCEICAKPFLFIKGFLLVVAVERRGCVNATVCLFYRHRHAVPPHRYLCAYVPARPCKGLRAAGWRWTVVFVRAKPPIERIQKLYVRVYYYVKHKSSVFCIIQRKKPMKKRGAFIALCFFVLYDYIYKREEHNPQKVLLEYSSFFVA